MNIQDKLVARWNDPEARPLFKGSLIDNAGCMCAQGDALATFGGYTPEKLRSLGQPEADAETAKLLGISRAHAILLRNVNDSEPGAPSIVLTNPEVVLGDQAHIVLAFWRHLDRMTEKQWAAARAVAGAAARDAARAAARAAAWAAAWAAAGDAAGDAAWAAARAVAGAAARDAARASNEIQGASIMRANGTPFYFLPLFGFADPEAVLAAQVQS